MHLRVRSKCLCRRNAQKLSNVKLRRACKLSDCYCSGQHANVCVLHDRDSRLQWPWSICGPSSESEVDQCPRGRRKRNTKAEEFRRGLWTIFILVDQVLSENKQLNRYIWPIAHSSTASLGARPWTPLPRKPKDRRWEATLPAPSSGTGWYLDSATGAHPSL